MKVIKDNAQQSVKHLRHTIKHVMGGFTLKLNEEQQAILEKMEDSRLTMKAGDIVVATFCNAGFSTLEGLLEPVDYPDDENDKLCFPADNDGIYGIVHGYHVVLKADYLALLAAAGVPYPSKQGTILKDPKASKDELVKLMALDIAKSLRKRGAVLGLNVNEHITNPTVDEAVMRGLTSYVNENVKFNG